MRLARDTVFFCAGAFFAFSVILNAKEGSFLKFLTISESNEHTNTQTPALRSNHSVTDKRLNATNATEKRLNEPNDTVHNSETRHRVRFIPFPHKTLGSGMEVACNWTTRSIMDGRVKQDGDSQDNFGRVAGVTLDKIQVAAFQEGVCIPENETLRSSLHVFSTAEAIECLSSSAQNQNASVIIAGDSYNRQLFIGLTDIIFAYPSDVQMSGKNRMKAVNSKNNSLKSRRQKDPSFPDVAFVCTLECYGEKSFSNECSKCINSFTAKSPHVAAVVGTSVHILSRRMGNVNATVNEIEAFLTKSNHVTFNSMPSYQRSKIPFQYRNASHHTNAEALYHQTLGHVAPHIESRPFIDFFQLTRSCVWENCSFDGGHRSRFVNRWKAQLLLNTICEYEEVVATE